MKNDLFTEIIGQHTAKLLLTEAIERNQIAPAYLFSSEVEGVGKRKTALAFANAILSKGSRSAIAGESKHLDILQIKPTYTENTSQQKSVPAIRVEQVREVIEFLSTSAVEGKQKVVIIHEADMINPTAANKLLKTLEEPKTGTFILISSYPQKLLPTIKSRCQIILFQRLTDEEVISVLKDQQIEATEKILAISSGSPGQAIANIKMLASISQEITKQLEVPPDDILKALSLSNSISSWNHQTQLWLLTYLQYNWWQKLKSTKLLAKFTQARQQLLHHVTPRSVWDSLLLP
ncbi:AAA family ATPase [Nostoc sp. FACHB-973]|uniref:DNA polymerase III subunit delta n=1 Tax=Nostoc minutum NIES-26 TaxID=1844469 RepID=A0A367QPN6_9NOSO|nr:AAA family ATPase [Nostoc sp. FACHB-973]RCJ25919.1 DNA polymerase III subunit delta' [Nostoc minutum NIES-26]